MTTSNFFRVAVATSICLAALARPAAAETTATVNYPYEQVWPAAVRFLRIDEGVRVIEKDSEAGYVLFELQDDGATYRGSFEIAALTDTQGRSVSRLVVTINDRPAYMELGLIDRFRTKLRRQLGPPPRAPEKPKKPKKSPGDKPPADEPAPPPAP